MEMIYFKRVMQIKGKISQLIYLCFHDYYGQELALK